MTYSIGQRVRVRPDLKASNTIYNVCVRPEMLECAGKVYIVSEIIEHPSLTAYCIIAIDDTHSEAYGWVWSDDLLLPANIISRRRS